MDLLLSVLGKGINQRKSGNIWKYRTVPVSVRIHNHLDDDQNAKRKRQNMSMFGWKLW